MTGTDWKRQLRREASIHHMCEENRFALEAVENKEEAIALYIRTIDWALEEGYPALRTLRESFSDCEKEGIFIDHEFHGEVLDSLPTYIFHNCKGIIRTGLNLQEQIIPMLYFANDCDMEIRGTGKIDPPARVPLYVFGYNNVTFNNGADEGITCVTYNFKVK